MALSNVRNAIGACSQKLLLGAKALRDTSNLRELATTTSFNNKYKIISGNRRYCKDNRNNREEAPPSTSHIGAPVYKHSPSLWDKRILVWTKKYPSIDQVPQYVSRETMDKAKNKTRIYLNLLMGAVTILACVAMIISGKRAVKRGESVQQMNLDWHKKQQ